MWGTALRRQPVEAAWLRPVPVRGLAAADERAGQRGRVDRKPRGCSASGSRAGRRRPNRRASSEGTQRPWTPARRAPSVPSRRSPELASKPLDPSAARAPVVLEHRPARPGRRSGHHRRRDRDAAAAAECPGQPDVDQAASAWSSGRRGAARRHRPRGSTSQTAPALAADRARHAPDPVAPEDVAPPAGAAATLSLCAVPTTLQNNGFRLSLWLMATVSAQVVVGAPRPRCGPTTGCCRAVRLAPTPAGYGPTGRAACHGAAPGPTVRFAVRVGLRPRPGRIIPTSCHSSRRLVPKRPTTRVGLTHAPGPAPGSRPD